METESRAKSAITTSGPSLLFLYILLQCVSPLISGATSSDVFYFEVKENSKADVFVGKIDVRNGFTYRFNDDPPEFKLDANTGVIATTNVATDRETKSFYHLVILSSSPTYPLEVKIKVLDVNDNKPYWPPNINTNLSFSESAPIGTKVIVDTALDADEGHLHYQINTNANEISDSYYSTTSLPFKLSYNISSAFLHLEVADRLDREAQSSYVLNISAIDEGFKSSSVLFYIKILDSNDNPPIFDHSDYSVALNENVGKDVSILQVRATDADEEGNDNSKISYYLLSNDHFNIDANTGVISTSHEGPLNCGTVSEESDTEYWKVCVFTVFAHDYGTPRQDGRTYVTAKIRDANNHAPAIKFRYFSRSDHAGVDENAANGSVVAAVSVVDLDHGLNGMTTISIADGDKFGHFRLESIGNSHIIRVNGSLDREKISSYNLTIRAYDHGTPTRSSSAYLIIVVYDHNDHSPKFSKEVFETSIKECEDQTGVYVTSMTATDSDEGINSNLFYSLSGHNSHYFKIDSITGLITTDKPINREEIDSFELRVTARDGGSTPKWAHTLLRVKILDINDEIPSIEIQNFVKHDNKTNSFWTEIEENSFVNISLKTIDHDIGPNGTVDLSLVYDYNGLFGIDNSSKYLFSTKALDYEECESYKLLIVAKDRGLANHELSSTTTIFIKVLDRDDISPLIYPQIYYSFVPLNQNSFNYSIVLSRIVVKDLDFQSAVNFVIHSYDPLVPQMFALSRNGEIKLKSTTNLQTMHKNLPNFVKFNITCNGCQKGWDDSQINIYFINPDINPLSREVIQRKYSFDVKENEPIGTVVGNVDIDVTKYRLLLVSGDLDNKFSLERNSLRIGKHIDREDKSSYKLQLIAANDQHFFQIDVAVNVLDVNDCHPIFHDNYVEIDLNEDLSPKSTVYTFKAIDPDFSNQMNISLIEYRLNSNPKKLFYIENNKLKLSKSINALFDRNTNRRSETITVLDLEVSAIDTLLQKSQPLSDTDFEYFDKNSKPNKFSNKLKIFLNIKSVNRHRPRLAKSFYEISINESTPVNHQFLKIVAIDDDGDEIGFNIRDGNINNTFGIFPDGNLFVKRFLDRESMDTVSLTVDVFEVSSRSENRLMIGQNVSALGCQVLIHIIDVNDNRPQFVNNTFNFTIAENSPMNTLIGQVMATDADIGSNSEIHYTIVKSYYSPYVEIDSLNGYIWSKAVLDREVLSSFEVVAQAVDHPLDGNSFSSHAVIRIEILDVNDNPPVFEMPVNVTARPKISDNHFSADLSVSEDFPLNATIAVFKALDLDIESKIEYKIIKSKNSNYFTIDSKTGVLKVDRKLDREAIDRFDLILEANDGRFTSNLTLHVLVDDVNDNPPVWVNFTRNVIAIPENTSIGSEIFRLNATDADIGVNALVRFEIQSQNKKYFDIQKQSLVVVNRLDYETENVHYLNITAIDEMGLRSDTKTLKIIIQDVNDCSPIFAQRSDSEVVKISENLEVGTKLLILQAFDCDAGDVLRYEIISCDTHYQTRRRWSHSKQSSEVNHVYDTNNCPLRMDSTTGQVVNINLLDREVIESINLKVKVTDSGGHFDRKKIVFLIDDINDEKPVFVSPNKIVLKHDFKGQNEVIGRIEAIDMDVGINSVITYKLMSSEFSSYLKLDPQTGVLTATKKLDRTNRRSVNVPVMATDGSGLSTSDNLTLILLSETLSQQNTSAKVISINLYENEPPGTRIGQLECRPDPTKQSKSSNSSKSCEYYIVNSTDRTFAVDEQTGSVYIDGLIDREVRDSYDIEVLILSRYSLEKIQILVSILDQNDNPPHLKNTSASVHISESSPVDLQVFDLSKLIVDEDTSNKFEFQIINCSRCEDVFLLNKRSGVISLKSRLDREKISHYRILFGVSDGIYLLTSALDIYVDDVSIVTLVWTLLSQLIRRSPNLTIAVTQQENDNIPYFNSSYYSFDVEENSQIGLLVGKITASDKDISSRQLVYSIVDQKPVKDVFILDGLSGQFTLNKQLDYETDPKQFVVICEANDGYFRSESVKVVFNVVNVEDNAPVFDNNLYKIDVYENTASKVMCVSAKDADISVDSGTKSPDKTKMNYYFEASSQSHLKQKTIADNFEIDLNSGCISVIKELDREKRTSHELVVVADDGTFRTSATVQIKVLDVNDNSPFFEENTPNTLKVYENSALGTTLFTFKAYDLDEPPNNYIQYDIRIKDSSKAQTFPFAIGATDGVLKVSGHVDKEVTSDYRFTVRASDGTKWTEKEIFVEVIDVLDDTPSGQFEVTQTEVNIFDNSSVGEILVRHSGSDTSIDQTDKVYSMSNPDPMSIGVILVISFFLILILVISTSFLIFHNQKKNQLRECNTNQRKMTATIKPYMSSTPSPPSTLPSMPVPTSPTHNLPTRLPSKHPDVVSPILVPPSTERPRPVPPAVPASISHSHCTDNYNDNYSNLMATAEHYDLENASSIAPSDIDIVYHFRNRNSQPLHHHRHAPLSRLSPSVSDISSMPRILTLQDLSPQVPPCPPLNNRTSKPKPNENFNEDEDEEEDDDHNNSDDSFTCSEFDENYDVSKKTRI